MSTGMPPARELLAKALKLKPRADLNELHEETYRLMVMYKNKYYKSKVDAFLSTLDLEDKLEQKLRKAMLKSVVVDDIEYSNFMEEASRRISQTFQVISGNLAELVAERELIKFGLEKGKHYETKKYRTDLIVYHPQITQSRARHRVEVKNVKLRERATRGLAFDGDSLFGFFNAPGEFTPGNVEELDKSCEKTGGFCYIPPTTLNKLSFKGRHFKPNTLFGRNMKNFVKTGKIG